MKVAPLLFGHRTNDSLRRQTVGDRGCPSPGVRADRNIADAWSEDSGSVRPLTGHNSMSGTPGAGTRATTGEADQQRGAGSPRPPRFNRDPLGPGILWYPRKRRSRPSGKLGPGLKRKHSDRVAIHLGLKQG